jgi:uncharacterized protein
MQIENMTYRMSLDLLDECNVGRIACAKDAQPYVTPFSYAHHDGFIYSFATVGQKIEWMRANPCVCAEVEKIISLRDWRTVVVIGRFEELKETPEFLAVRQLAHDVLAKKAMWWEPGYVKTLRRGEERRLVPVYFRIAIMEITGHRAFDNDPMA